MISFYAVRWPNRRKPNNKKRINITTKNNNSKKVTCRDCSEITPSNLCDGIYFQTVSIFSHAYITCKNIHAHIYLHKHAWAYKYLLFVCLVACHCRFWLRFLNCWVFFCFCFCFSPSCCIFSFSSFHCLFCLNSHQSYADWSFSTIASIYEKLTLFVGPIFGTCFGYWKIFWKTKI